MISDHIKLFFSRLTDLVWCCASVYIHRYKFCFKINVVIQGQAVQSHSLADNEAHNKLPLLKVLSRTVSICVSERSTM